MRNIIASEDAKLTIQCRALMVLTCLSSKLLETASKNSLGVLILKYSDSTDYRNNVYLRDAVLVIC